MMANRVAMDNEHGDNTAQFITCPSPASDRAINCAARHTPHASGSVNEVQVGLRRNQVKVVRGATRALPSGFSGSNALASNTHTALPTSMAAGSNVVCYTPV